jgi:hypothetical protein
MTAARAAVWKAAWEVARSDALAAQLADLREIVARVGK